MVIRLCILLMLYAQRNAFGFFTMTGLCGTRQIIAGIAPIKTKKNQKNYLIFDRVPVTIHQ